MAGLRSRLVGRTRAVPHDVGCRRYLGNFVGGMCPYAGALDFEKSWLGGFNAYASYNGQFGPWTFAVSNFVCCYDISVI